MLGKTIRDEVVPFWHIRLFGSLHLMREQQTVVRFGTRKPGILLVCLALPPGKAQGREYLTETLWPDSDVTAARANLRFVLHSLKKDLEPAAVPPGSVLYVDATTVELCAGSVTTDVQQFEKAVGAALGTPLPSRERIALLKEAAHLYQNDLLTGFYETWIIDERERLKERNRLGLSTLARLLEEEGDFRTALFYAEAAAKADVLREESHTHLIRLHLALGDAPSAQKQYRHMEKIFQTQMNHGPSTSAKALVPIIRDDIRKQNPLRSASDTLPSHPAGSEASAFSFALPRPLTKFFDRPECGQIIDTFRSGQTRLLTLTGPSGSGKTRLSIEAAQQLRGVFGSAIYFLPAAEYENTELLTNAILDAVGLHRTGARKGEDGQNEISGNHDAAVSASEGHPSLLVLDGIEHLVESGRMVVHDVLQHVPHLFCLATSLVRLQLSGESVLEVCPLPTPERSDRGEQIADNVSYRMLLDRIHLVRPDFAVTGANRDEIVDLCQRLEGLPLSIELAAPWLQVLSLHEILQQLSDPFTLLVSDRADVPVPHRSLHDAVQRSYRLLPQHLCEFFCGLSVFETGWTREAAGAVLQEPQAASFLRQLREYSLVQTTERGDKVHFYLLDVVKKFGWSLLKPGKRNDLARRHAEYYLHLGFEAESHIGEAAREEWFAELDLRMPNFRRALDWCLENNKEQYLFLAATLWVFWYLRGHVHEGQNRLRQAMLWSEQGKKDIALLNAGSIKDFGTEPAAAKVLLGLACLAWTQNEGQAGRGLLQQSLALFQAVCSPSSTAAYLSGLAKFGAFRGDYELARSLLQEAGSLWQESLENPKKGEPASHVLRWELADSIRRLGDVAYCEADFNSAQQKYEESAAIFETEGNAEGIAATYTGMGVVARARGNYDAARDYLNQSLRIRGQQNDWRGIATAQRILSCIETRAGRFEQAHAWAEECFTTLSSQSNVDGMTGQLIIAGILALCENENEKAEELLRAALGLAKQRANSRRAAYSRCFLSLALLRGSVPAASPLLKNSLRWFYEVGDKSGLALSLEVYAALAAEENRSEKAASLWGVAGNIRETIGSPTPPSYAVLYNRHLDKARQALGAGHFEKLEAISQHTLSPRDVLADVA